MIEICHLRGVRVGVSACISMRASTYRTLLNVRECIASVLHSCTVSVRAQQPECNWQWAIAHLCASVHALIVIVHAFTLPACTLNVRAPWKCVHPERACTLSMCALACFTASGRVAFFTTSTYMHNAHICVWLFVLHSSREIWACVRACWRLGVQAASGIFMKKYKGFLVKLCVVVASGFSETQAGPFLNPQKWAMQLLQLL